MSATRPGVAVNPRQEMLAEVVKAREAQIAEEIKEGGGDPSVLSRDKIDDDAPVDDPNRPAEIPLEEWAGLSDEAKGNLLTEIQTRKETEAAAAAAGTETEEQKQARLKKEEEDKAAADAAAKKAADDAEAKKVADAAAAAAPGAAPAKKIKIKVDGVEQEVDEAAVLEAGRRALQKETAADKRLEEATRVGAEAKRLHEQALELIKTAARGGEPAPASGTEASPPQGGKPPALTDEILTATVKAIQYGDEAAAKEALKNLVATMATSGQSEELTQAQVVELLDFREARQWVEGEFKDLFADERMRRLFSTEERTMRAAGDGRPYREVYKDIGEKLREWKTSLAPAPTPAPAPAPAPTPAPAPAARTDANARKTTLVTVTQAGARQPTSTPTKEPTPSQVVDQMRKARHQ